ncbi:hypothetical protein [uncultured Desulfobacter sp.]|uniref:hypothetical protein n=1 Tax=uncultured Desulfobacter sp. TaxID=240139 RepID=UPI002AAA63D4|nr:hypothetical protein [uncultured Desulfobacter sp.]
MAGTFCKYDYQKGDKMIWHNTRADAIALYGSQLRSDFDELSDKDIMLVGNCINDLCVEKHKFEKLGFSCGLYTWDRLARMKEKGSLFIQHLKQESLILKDEGFKLALFLNSYEVKPDYSKDIDYTKSLIASTEYIADDEIIKGWVLDILAVAVRNIGILKLANEGKYVFGFPYILKELESISVINKEMRWQLLQLRRWKQLYRNRAFHLMPNIKALQSFQSTIGKAFNIDFDSKILSSENLKNNLKTRGYRHSDRYCRFRLFEAVIGLYIYHQSPIDSSLIHKFNLIVKNQNQYGLFCNDLSRPLKKIIKELNQRTLCQKVFQPDVFRRSFVALKNAG